MPMIDSMNHPTTFCPDGAGATPEPWPAGGTLPERP